MNKYMCVFAGATAALAIGLICATQQGKVLIHPAGQEITVQGSQTEAAAPKPAAPEMVGAMAAPSAEDFAGELKAPEKKADTVRLAFEANPTTGYDWVMTDPDGLFQEEDYSVPGAKKDSGAAADAGETLMVGGSGEHIFCLTPTHAGTGAVTFSYERPWEHASAASRTYIFEVDDDLHVRLVGVTGHNTASFPFSEEFVAPEITAM